MRQICHYQEQNAMALSPPLKACQPARQRPASWPHKPHRAACAGPPSASSVRPAAHSAAPWRFQAEPHLRFDTAMPQPPRCFSPDTASRRTTPRSSRRGSRPPSRSVAQTRSPSSENRARDVNRLIGHGYLLDALASDEIAPIY